MPMTSAAKSALSRKIRALRERLLADLHDATEGAYRLSVRAQDAGLGESRRVRRKRLEDWLDEQERVEQASKPGKKAKRRSREDLRRDIEKQAAYTLLNRLIILRLMEAPGPSGQPLRTPALVTGGWSSPAYRQFVAVGSELLHDPTEGYDFLLQVVFEDLAAELPGIFGSAGAADLVPVPPATLRHLITEINDAELESCWSDDMTLGWVYQYWNDPEREALDAKLNSGGKVENHEIASKTQMFTERYMVDWLLQNSLGPMWLAMCKKRGWTPTVEADGTLARLEERRVAWRGKRERGEVALSDLMPLHTEAERRWAYYVPQPIPDDAVIPSTIRDIKILDPAAGSGHFLVVAVDLLLALYREEAAHRSEQEDPRWSDRACVERILSHNLHGIDLDPRAMQIAAAALWLKARHLVPDAHPRRINLVASNLGLAHLPDDDPALVELRTEVQRETGIPARLTDTIFHALKGADHLGSLLKVDKVVDAAIRQHEALGRAEPVQAGLFDKTPPQQQRIDITPQQARDTLLHRMERFLDAHTGSEDLGLRLHGEQLAKGVRFVRMVQESTYDLVVANPPYQGASKMADSRYLETAYPLGKADLYAAFLLRGLELVREGGVSAMLTMRNWMFIKTYAGLREHLLGQHGLYALGDFEVGAFEEVGGMVVSVCVSVFHRGELTGASIAQKLTLDGNEGNAERTQRKRAATLCHEGRHTFDPAALKVVPEWPLVYWWDAEMLRLYQSAPLIGDVAPGRAAQSTGDNPRFVRFLWEVSQLHQRFSEYPVSWFPFINGGKGREWMEELREVANWAAWGLPVKSSKCYKTGVETCSLASEDYFAKGRGIAFSMIGSSFSARVHRYPSIFGNKGSSVFPEDLAGAVCAMNSARSRQILQSLNPGIGFEVGDVNRLPLFPIANADDIFATIESAFTVHESHREPSVEYRCPGPSPWRHAQDWAQAAVDRPEGAPLPAYTEVLDPEPPTDHFSFALGVALGRFGPEGNDREGILDPITTDLSHAVPHGILLLDGTLEKTEKKDDLGHAAATVLHTAWSKYGAQIDARRDNVRDYLRLDFFSNVHVKMYERRPIHWPLSSANKTFVAWINIHRWTGSTLTELLAKLVDVQKRLDGEIADQREIRDGTDQRAARAAEKRLSKLQDWHSELVAFIVAITTCAEKGPPPTHPGAAKCPPRERDARYVPDLDDGVMINSAALWPLLDPQWNDPKKWWIELAAAQGRKDYDWSHLAMRYFPTRVDAKCKEDPSLGVAHGCFWLYHPARAWAWELRLQEEIGPDFRIEETGYTLPNNTVSPDHTALRAAYLRDQWEEALAAVQKEAERRCGRGKNKKLVPEMTILEPGLWGEHPEECWALEIALSEKQGIAFFLRAPDEPAARAAFEKENPKRVKARAALMADLKPVLDLFDDAEDDEDLDGESDDSEEET